jgi:hypothetical protein
MQDLWDTIKRAELGLRCSLVLENLPSMCEALGSTTNTKKKRQKQKKDQTYES